jgi:hypothetical protein
MTLHRGALIPAVKRVLKIPVLILVASHARLCRTCGVVAIDGNDHTVRAHHLGSEKRDIAYATTEAHPGVGV